MKILMILANPFTNDARVYNEAISLIKAGHNVTVLAWDKTKKHSAIDKKDKINIIRSYNSKFMDVLPYDIFRLHFWWKKGYRDALKIYEKKRFDVVHCHDLSSLPIGVKLKKKLGIVLVYDAHEIWGNMVAKDLPKWWSNYYFRLEKRLIKNADNVIIAEDRYSDYFKGITNKKLVTILNCKHIISKDYISPKNKKFTIIYIGTVNAARYILELIDVVKEIKDVNCIIGGIGKKDYVNEIENKVKSIKNINFLGTVPLDDVIPLTLKSNAVVCMINPDIYNNKIATANKQFEAMVCGRPIICTKGTRSGEITEQEKCGLVVEYSKKSLREAIIKLKDSPMLCEDLGKNAFKSSLLKYNWDNQEKKLVNLYKNI